MGDTSGGSTGMSMGRDRTHNGATSTYLGDDAGRRPGMLDQLMNDYRTTYSGANANANRLLGGGSAGGQIGNNSGYEAAGYDWNPDTNSNFASYGGTGADPSITDPARQQRINYGPGGAPPVTGADGGGGGTGGGGGGEVYNGDPLPGPSGTDWGKEGGPAAQAPGAGAPAGASSSTGGAASGSAQDAVGNNTTDSSAPGLMDFGNQQMWNPETAADQEVNQGWRDYSQQSPDEASTNNAWKQYASGPTSQETGLINSAQTLADASDPRLAAASAAKTNVGATTGDKYLGSQYKGMVEHGGLTPTQAAALTTSADLADRSGFDTARADIGRTIARRGNAAGAYQAESKLGSDQATAAGARARQNILDQTALQRQDKTAGLAGLGDVSGREQALNTTQGQIDASRNAQNASLADAGSNRTLSATTSGLSALGSALNNQRGYQATGISGTAASNAALAAKQAGALTAGQQSAKDMAARRQAGATLNKGIYDSESQKQLAAMNAAAGLGTKPRELYTDGTSTTGSGGFSI